MGSSRYARIEQMEAIGPEGLARLHSVQVAVIGVGNIGGQVAAHLGMLGVGLVLVDRDVVSEENLGTQGFAEEDLGLPKVVARARSLSRHNATCPVEPVFADIGRLGLGALRHVDLIFSCLDSRRARVAVNEVASRLGVPWVDAGVDGEGRSFLVRVSAYGGTPESACYLCPHDRDSLRGIMREHMPEGCPAWHWGQADVTAPTLAISAVGAAAAAAQVIWGVQILLGRGDEVVGREMHLDLVLNRLATHRLPRNPHCVFDHQAFSFSPVGRPVGAVTLAETFDVAEAELGGGVTLQVHRRSLVTELRCPACNRVGRPYRMLEAMTADAARCACGGTMEPVAVGLRDRFQRDEGGEFRNRTWGELGLPAQDVVTAIRGAREIHFLFS